MLLEVKPSVVLYHNICFALTALDGLDARAQTDQLLSTDTDFDLQGMHSGSPAHHSVPDRSRQHLRLALTLLHPAQPHPLPPTPCPPPAPLVRPWTNSSKPLPGALPHPSLALPPAQPLSLQKANLKASLLLGLQLAAVACLPCSLPPQALARQTPAMTAPAQVMHQMQQAQLLLLSQDGVLTFSR